MTLLDVEVWSGKIAAGSWRPGEGPPLRVREAASGEEIGRLGTASVEQAVEAARRAATAQRAWARMTPAARAGTPEHAGVPATCSSAMPTRSFPGSCARAGARGRRQRPRSSPP